MIDIDTEEDYDIEISSYFFNDLRKYHVFTHEEQKELIKKARSGCEKSKEIFLSSNMPLVISIANHYTDKRLPFLDLIQEGFLGMLQAYEKFDLSLDNHFSTYAIWWIRQTITRALIDKSRDIRLPIRVVDKLTHIKKTKESLDKNNDFTTTIEDIAHETDISTKQINKLLNADRDLLSIDYEYGNEDNDKCSGLNLQSEDNIVKITEKNIARDKIETILQILSEREAKIIRSRFGLNKNNDQMTLNEVGLLHGITRERVRQIEKKALDKLKRYTKRHNIKLEDYI